MPMTFTPPPGTPSGFTPPPAPKSPSGFVPPSGGSLGGTPFPMPGTPAGGLTPPPGFMPPPAAGSAENYVPTKIQFPKWLHVVDIVLVAAAVCSGFLLYKAYAQRVDSNRRLESAASAAAMNNAGSEVIVSENPFPGKRFLIFRNSRNALMAAVVDAPDDAVITWNKGITINKKNGEVAQFQMEKDGTWKSLGNFGHLTEYAKEIVVGNTKVCNQKGDTVFEPSMCKSGHFYSVYEESVPWEMAMTACESNGGHLVTVGSQTEQQLVTQIAEGRYLWMGGKITESGQKNWKWITKDEPMDFTAWGPNQPDHINGNRIVLADSVWVTEDHTSMSTDGYICEWDAKTMMNTFDKLRNK